jgi:hypothetical protein
MKISPLQEYKPSDWSGLTTKNHLGALYGIEPQKASKLVTRIHQINFGMDLDTYLSQFGTKTLESDEDFTWMLQGTGDKNIPIQGYSASNAAKPGINFSEFTVTFAERMFFATEVIVGEKNEKYSLRIVDEPVLNGNYWDYTVVLMTADPQAFMPPSELAVGKRFSKDWAISEQTLSVRGGGVNYTSPFSMRNQFSFLRIQDTRPGNMISKPIGHTIIGEDGKKYDVWMQYADFQLERQFRKMKNRLMMYGTSNRTAQGNYMQKGDSGYEIKQGAGIRQQMEASNTAFYNDFDIKWLTQLLLDLSVGKLSEGERKFVLRTGEWGMYQFHLALEDFASLYTPLFDQNRVYKGKGNAMGFRGQFLEYMGPNGIVVQLMHDPMKDDPERNKIKHPNGGLAESYRYDILDMGMVDGEPNIQKVEIKGQGDIVGYEAGLRNPFTPDLANNIMSNPVDGYTVHRACYTGVMVKDPTRTASLIPNILQ